MFESVKKTGHSLVASVRRLLGRQPRSFIKELPLPQVRSLLDAIPVGLHILSPDGKIIFVNRKEAEMLGRGKEEIEGRSFTAFIADKQQEAWERFQLKLQGGKVEKVVDRTVLTREGERIPVTSEDTLIYNGGAEPTGIITALIDITELKQLQERLQQQRQSEVVSSIAGGVVHDFNNMLAANIGAVGLAMRFLDEGKLDQVRGNLKAVLETDQHMARLIAKLRKLSGKHQVEDGNIAFSLTESARDALQLFELTETKGKEVKTSSDLEEIGLEGHPGDIQDALFNLLINARDAISAKGAISVTLRRIKTKAGLNVQGGKTLPPGKYAELLVSDNGSGIPSAVLAKMFEPYYTTKAPHSNSGLGLAQVLGIVTGHGGGIMVTSREGVGTTFRLYFPLAKQSEIAPESDREKGKQP